MKIEHQKHRMDIHKADLSGSKFDDVNLSGSDFHNINMSGCCFDDLNMTGWRVHNANLGACASTKPNSRALCRQRASRRRNDRRDFCN